MIVARPKCTTRVLGKSQGFLGLPIVDIVVDGKEAMVSSWEPTPGELEALNKGANVKVTVLGTVHPPILVFVEKDTAE